MPHFWCKTEKPEVTARIILQLENENDTGCYEKNVRIFIRSIDKDHGSCSS